MIIKNFFHDETPIHTNIIKRNFKQFKEENFVNECKQINWTNVLNNDNTNVNNQYNNFLLTINNILDKHAPFKTLNKKELKLKQKPWVSLGIQKSMKIRDKFHKKYIKEKNKLTKNDYHCTYKKYRNKIVELLRISKTNHYKKYFEENKNNIKNIWIGINSIITSKNSKHLPPTCITSNNMTILEPQKIANEFNDFFTTISSKLKNKIRPSETNISSYLHNANPNSFWIKPTDKTEVMNISSLNSSKSCGPNSIPTHVLKIIKELISSPLSELINLSFTTGIFPDMLKIAKVIPIYKAESKLLCNNYRPISLLSNISKIIEKLMHSRLNMFLSEFNCLYSMQFGFRCGTSTSHTLISITEAIQNSIDTGKFACGVFIDLQKAFDTVNHDILLTKLSHYGIRGTTNKWFQSYLKIRKQFVSINGFESDHKEINCGVPQSSILGPLLFIIYINDLHKAIKYSIVHHFADDTNLLYTENSIKQLSLKGILSCQSK